MHNDFYVQFSREELILRDYLAVDRTILANARTLMAYIRTSLTMAAVGASLIHFFEPAATNIGGGLLLIAAAVIFGLGLRQFIWYRRHLKNLSPDI